MVQQYITAVCKATRQGFLCGWLLPSGGDSDQLPEDGNAELRNEPFVSVSFNGLSREMGQRPEQKKDVQI